VGQSIYLAGTANSDLPTWVQFKELTTYLRYHGFEIKQSFPATHFIGMNHAKDEYSDFIKAGGKQSRAVLVLLEPRAVYPSQYKLSVFQKYSLVLRPGNPSFAESQDKFIGWPYESNPNPLIPSNEDASLAGIIDENITCRLFEFETWQHRRDYLVLINSNKVSAISEENYSLRRSFAKGIDKEFLSVYGDLWTGSFWKKVRHRIEVLVFASISGVMPNLKSIYGSLHVKYPGSKGVVPDKHKILKNSKFSLVIENDPSYISEKLFDSMLNGSIPVYRGPIIPDAIVPKGTYLSLPEYPHQLLPILEALTELDVNSFLTNIRNYISSNDFISIWGKEHVFADIGQVIVRHFGAESE
jgi:hypothetical protein